MADPLKYSDVLALDLIAQKLGRFDRQVDDPLELVGEIRQIVEQTAHVQILRSAKHPAFVPVEAEGEPCTKHYNGLEPCVLLGKHSTHKTQYGQLFKGGD